MAPWKPQGRYPQEKSNDIQEDRNEPKEIISHIKTTTGRSARSNSALGETNHSRLDDPHNAAVQRHSLPATALPVATLPVPLLPVAAKLSPDRDDFSNFKHNASLKCRPKWFDCGTWLQRKTIAPLFPVIIILGAVLLGMAPCVHALPTPTRNGSSAEEVSLYTTLEDSIGELSTGLQAQVHSSFSQRFHLKSLQLVQ